MEFIKQLSDKGVTLCKQNGKLVVVRKVTKELLNKILLFYKESDFSFKPNLNETDGESFFVEDFLHGDLLLKPDYKKTKNVALNISLLSKNQIGQQHLKEYIENQFNEKINSVTLSEKEQKIIKGYLDIFINSSKNILIDLNWTHGDLKGDNIITKKGIPYFIDWEWVKKGHYVEDMQKFIQSTLKYDKISTDDFINNFYKYKSTTWDLFVLLETFHFFLNQVLQLSKKRITLDFFEKSVGEKINSMINASLYYTNINGKIISIGSVSKMSNIFDSQNKLPDNQKPEHIMSNNDMNNQEQRLEINKGLMLKEKDFIVLHGITFRLKNGKNIIIGGLSGSGKTYVFEKLKNAGLVEELYDEDLINLDKDGLLKPLGKKVFKGKKNGQYIYEDATKTNFGNIDIVIFVDNSHNIKFISNSNFTNLNVIKYLIHERYVDNKDIIKYYKEFTLPNPLIAYTLKNDKQSSDFSQLIRILGNL
ncbi:MAG: hypothetical protein WC850_05705 [Candidatus Gracilibacteria bacterium]